VKSEARPAEPQAQCDGALVVRGVHQFGAEIGGSFLRQMRRIIINPQPERREPGIVITEPVFSGCRRQPIPRERQGLGEVLDHDLGPQLVEVQLADGADVRALGQSRKNPPPSSVRFGHNAIDDDLALRRQ